MRLIDADALKRIVNADINRCYALGISSVGPLSHFRDQIDEQPTVGAVEVVHGRWKLCGANFYQNFYNCSVCGASYDGRPNYCPNCGAKMDKEEPHGTE